jgi:hypothetical protein
MTQVKYISSSTKIYAVLMYFSEFIFVYYS